MERYIRERQRQLERERQEREIISRQEQARKLAEEQLARRPLEERQSAVLRAQRDSINKQRSKILDIERQSGIIGLLQEIVDYANRNKAFRGRETDFGFGLFGGKKEGKGDGKVVEKARLEIWDDIPELPVGYNLIELESYEKGNFKLREPSRVYDVSWKISVTRHRGSTEWNPGPDVPYAAAEDRGFVVYIYADRIEVSYGGHHKTITSFTDRSGIREAVVGAYLGDL